MTVRPLTLDRYAARCEKFVLVVTRIAVVTRMAVLGARSAPRETGDQPRALQGYHGQRPWLVTACLMAAFAVPTTPVIGAAAAGQDPQKNTPVQEPARHEGGTATMPAPAATTPAPAATVPTPAATTAPPAVIAPSADAFRIGPEDVLDVQVWKNAELSRVVPVRPDGMISLPLVNDIRASGLTPVELRQQITQRLSEFVPSPEVSVIVREVHSVKVAVLGAVRMPGHYEVNSTATVLDLIARAQGLTEFADRGRIVVLRQNGKATKRIPFNYRKVADGSDQENFVVQPGDIIVVP